MTLPTGKSRIVALAIFVSTLISIGVLIFFTFFNNNQEPNQKSTTPVSENLEVTPKISSDALALENMNQYFGKSEEYNLENIQGTPNKSMFPDIETPQFNFSSDEKNLIVSLKARITSPQRSLAFGGAAFEDQDTVVLKVASVLSLQTSVANGAVTLTLRNTTNNLGGVQVEGVLPAGAAWKDEFIPSGEALSYSEETRTVFWDVGTLPAGTGSVLPVRSVTFQLDSPTGPFIIEEVKASATDLFTGSFLEDITQPI